VLRRSYSTGNKAEVQSLKEQVKVLFFYPKLPDFQKSIDFRKVRLRPFVFVVRGRAEQMSMEHRWNDTDRKKTAVLEEKTAPMSICRPQISHYIETGPQR